MTVPIQYSKLPKIRWGVDLAATPVEGLDLGLDDTFLTNWTITSPDGFYAPAYDPFNASWWSNFPSGVHVDASALFSWFPLEDPAPFIRESSAIRTFTDLTPGDILGLAFNFSWIVHVDWGKFQVILNGMTYEMPTLGNNLWNLGEVDTTNNRYLRVEVNEDGEIDMEFRFYEFRPSFNVAFQMSQGQIATLAPADLLFVMPPENLQPFPKFIGPELRSQLPSGFRDGWEADPVDVLEMQIKAIPSYGNNSDGSQWWGWEGKGGWSRFLEYASVGNSFLYFPDQENEAVSYECVLVDAQIPKPDKDWDRHQQFTLQIRTVSDTPILGY